MLLEGRLKFDGLAILELSVNFTGATLLLDCKAAFTNQASGSSLAWTSSKGPWSQNTIDTLRELRRSMEVDLLNVYCESGTLNLPDDRPRAGLPPGGIGEHLAEDDKQI